MRAMVTKDGGVADRVTGPMTRAQALKLKGLAEEAYQPERFAADLSFKEADASMRSRRRSPSDLF